MSPKPGADPHLGPPGDFPHQRLPVLAEPEDPRPAHLDPYLLEAHEVSPEEGLYPLDNCGVARAIVVLPEGVPPVGLPPPPPEAQPTVLQLQPVPEVVAGLGPLGLGGDERVPPHPPGQWLSHNDVVPRRGDDPLQLRQQLGGPTVGAHDHTPPRPDRAAISLHFDPPPGPLLDAPHRRARLQVGAGSNGLPRERPRSARGPHSARLGVVDPAREGTGLGRERLADFLGRPGFETLLPLEHRKLLVVKGEFQPPPGINAGGPVRPGGLL
mmetsp:Transcript_3211/g.8193  ORF Transcript_3211/g.8193 Transcript_3211/m.8193 type:complete len:269 (-) Transcript_3211:306-1112(-)